MATSGRQFKSAIYGHFSRVGKALANPHRLELLELLTQGPRTVEALAQATSMTVSNTSQHLQVLRTSGLVEAEKEGHFVTYRLAGEEVVPHSLSIMKDKRAKKVGTYLHNQRKTLTSYIDRLARELINMADTIDEHAVVLTAAAVYRIDRERATRFYAFRRGTLSKLRNRLLDALLGIDIRAPRLAQLFVETCRAITHCGRASSIVEGFNSILRKFLQIHKRMTEGALMLVTARWTLARRESGVLAGSCPFSALTGEAVEDWLVALGLFPTPAPTPTKRRLTLLAPVLDEIDSPAADLDEFEQAA